MSVDLGKVIRGLTLLRLSILLTLVLLALAVWGAGSHPSEYWALLVYPGLGLWCYGQVQCLATPTGRPWVWLALASGLPGAAFLPLLAVASSTTIQLLAFSPFLFLASVLLTLIFARQLGRVTGQRGLQVQGCLLVAVPFATWYLCLFFPWVGLALGIILILWAAIFSAYLGRVARALETCQTAQASSTPDA